MKALCGVQLMDRNIVKGLLLMLGLNEATDQLAVETVCIVLSREDDLFLQRILELDTKGQRRKVRLEWT